MAKPATRVLVAWEMGTGLGHIAPLSRIAAALQGRGMQIASAYLCRLENASVLAPFMAGPIRKAPIFPDMRQRLKGGLREYSVFSEFLGDVGFASPEILHRMIGLWRRIFEEDRPDLVLADYSPVALTAARSLGIATIASGAPYCLPPAHLDAFAPLLDKDAPRHYRESDLLATVNQVLADYGAEPLEAFPQIFDADVSAVSSFRILDYYDGLRLAPILPPLQRTVPAAPMPGHEVIAYFSDPGPADAPEWAALAGLDMPVRIISKELSPDIKALLARPNITLQQGLLSPGELASRARLLVHNGNHGTLCLAIAAALPQVCMPLHGENRSNCVGLAARGAATVLNNYQRTSDQIASAIHEAYDSQLRVARARALAAEVSSALTVNAGAAIADQVEAALQMRAEYFPAPAFAPQVAKKRLPRATGVATTRLHCYRINANAPDLRPARTERRWMNETSDRYAYRCIPLGIANASGWELPLSSGFEATWDGGSHRDAIVLRGLGGEGSDPQVANSHFGHGVLTFHTGYLLRTDPGWGILARGVPNEAKDGIAALEGLVETDWLPFPFTMNWRFTRPCTVRFEKGEIFCFIMPLAHMVLEEIVPQVLYLSDDADLQAEYDAWSQSRGQFLARLDAGDPSTVREAWQKFYVRGETATGQDAPDTHRAKRRLADVQAKAPGEIWD